MMEDVMEIRERPILFSAPMVQAILGNAKTQTRRIAKFSDIPGDVPNVVVEPHPGEWIAWWTNQTPAQAIEFSRRHYKPGDGFRCPYGAVGNRLWVREAWRVPSSMDAKNATEIAETSFDEGYPEPWCAIEHSDGERVNWVRSDGPVGRKRMARFMPRWASRITLEITGVRIERLQDITEADAIAEGVGHGFTLNAGWPDYTQINGNGVCELTQDTAAMSYASLWDSLHGVGAWASNPWVWALSFRRIV